MAGIILDGKKAASAWLGDLKLRVDALLALGITPGLVVVRVGDDPASGVYIANKERACRQIGIAARTEHLDRDWGQQSVIDAVDRLAAETEVHGILVQLPLPAGYDVEAIQERVPPVKDVDGLHPLNQGYIAQGRTSGFISATPCGILELLRRHQISTAGKHAVVVGRSTIVGRPMANLLSMKAALGDATVTICHSRTPDLASYVHDGDIVVAAMGRPLALGADHIRAGAVVIDVGINRIEDGTRKSGYRLVGDVAFDEVKEMVAAITPVPGGVGPMTVAGLVHNTVVAAERAAVAAGALAPA